MGINNNVDGITHSHSTAQPDMIHRREVEFYHGKTVFSISIKTANICI